MLGCAGAAYRARYIDPASCSANNTCLAGVSANSSLYGVVNTNGVAFSNYNLNVRSSALDRTIMTALSFLTGVLPPLNNATATRFLPDGQQARLHHQIGSVVLVSSTCLGLMLVVLTRCW